MLHLVGINSFECPFTSLVFSHLTCSEICVLTLDSTGERKVFLSVPFDDTASCKDYVASMTEERVAWGIDGQTRRKPLLVPLWQPPVTKLTGLKQNQSLRHDNRRLTTRIMPRPPQAKRFRKCKYVHLVLCFLIRVEAVP